ncbi:hypothetical protein Cgig2_032395 [Carnegiea gigantea]|uniref:Uncharacterized protein n=1 Tax=Carnegiea gigantea TaxID=171969 RepID=A0A9Q1JHL7_9CARY|nr:hypothetical protein Cgig2_032395 [Carnegiea gigantea]
MHWGSLGSSSRSLPENSSPISCRLHHLHLNSSPFLSLWSISSHSIFFSLSSGKGSSFEDLGRPLTDYEKKRHITMEKNARILEKLGLPKLKGSQHRKGIDKDEEYMPSDKASESEEDSENDNVDDVIASKGVALRQVDVHQPEEVMSVQTEQRMRSKRQATIAQDATRTSSDD